MRECRYILVLCLLSIVLCLAGCRPRGILTSRQMREVMIDLHKTDAVLQVCGKQYGHNEEEDMYYAAVLAEHHITQAQFDSSIVWYTNHPQLFDKIYPKVLKALHDDVEGFAAIHPEVLGIVEEQVSLPMLSREEARLQLDSLCWTIQHGAPIYGWHPGWERPAPKVPFAR